jgi:hypothetical protein
MVTPSTGIGTSIERSVSDIPAISVHDLTSHEVLVEYENKLAL